MIAPDQLNYGVPKLYVENLDMDMAFRTASFISHVMLFIFCRLFNGNIDINIIHDIILVSVNAINIFTPFATWWGITIGICISIAHMVTVLLKI
jgi:hypothetical protein